jgi:hypothetical protein
MLVINREKLLAEIAIKLVNLLCLPIKLFE